MKQLILTTAMLVATLPIIAGERIDRSMDVEPDSYIKIEHLSGQAMIKGWDKNEVKVEGELGDRTEKFIFEKSGNQVRIKVKVEGHRGWRERDGDKDNLEIFVPKGSSVKYESVNAEAQINDVQGGIDIEVVNGDILAIDVGGRVQLEAVNGDIQARNVKADRLKIETVNGNIEDRDSQAEQLVLESVNGDIESNNSSKDISIESVNGSIELDLGKVDDIQVTTVNGRIDATLALAKNASVRANTVGGGVNLNFKDRVSARFDIQTHAGGRIVNNLSDHEPRKAKYGPSRWLEFSLNGGDARVDISTVSGRIKLNRD